MLDDSRPWRLLIRVVHCCISLEIRLIQDFCLETHAAIFQWSKGVVKIGIDRASIDDMLRHAIPLLLVCQIIDAELHIDTAKHISHHLRIAADRDPLIECIEVIIIKSQPHWESLDNESRKLAAGTPPLLFRITFDELFIDVRPDQRNRLFFQILRLCDASCPSLFLDLGRRLLRRHDAPHFIEGVHIERQGIELAMIVGYR